MSFALSLKLKFRKMTTKSNRGRKMKIDFYTKLILTIIAICLVHLSIESFSFTKSAQAEDVVNVRIIGTLQPIDVNLSAIVGR